MCDYYDYESISEKVVTIRKERECSSCCNVLPVGTKMKKYVGKTEGDFSTTYGCPVCVFASAQNDGSRFHLCWNWGHELNYTSDGVPETVLWNYLKNCINNGISPNDTEYDKLVEEYRIKEENE